MKPRHWILLLLFIQGSVQAQQYTISGLITDSLSGDVLPGVQLVAELVFQQGLAGETDWSE